MAFLWGSPSTPASVSPSSATTPFWNGTNYGATQNYATSPIAGAIREQNLPVAFSEYLSGIGIADNDSGFNRWAYQQFPRFQRGYQMATLQNPFMMLPDYMQTIGGLDAMKAAYNQASPSARGLAWNRFAPGVRWISR